MQTGHSGRRVIASSPLLTVEACDCGVVHLHLGPATLRLRAEAIDVLAKTLCEASAKLSVGDNQLDVFTMQGQRGIA